MLGQNIISHIVDHYLGGEDIDLTPETPLLELNIIDSSALFDLVDFIRQQAGVSIPIQEVTPDNFMTVRRMVELTNRLQQGR